MARVLHEVTAVAAERRKRVSTGQMNRFLDKIDFQRAPVPMAKRVRIFYMTQAAVAPPTFVLFTDRDVKLHFTFERFLENQIREAFWIQRHADLVQSARAQRGEEGIAASIDAKLASRQIRFGWARLSGRPRSRQ